MPLDRAALRDLLAFYREAGVDVALGEAPVDRATLPEERPYAAPGAPATPTPARAPEPAAARRPVPVPPERAAPPAPPPQPLARAPIRPLAGEAALMAARETARSATTLADLEAALRSFEGCGLRFTAKQLVFADGTPGARVMLVGEAPGREEDEQGLPFVGRSGKLLDKMLAAIGLARGEVYIANVIPWRPPGNRTPTPQESEMCRPFIARQIELAAPEILVCLGGPAAQALIGVKDGILKSRGRWHAYAFPDGRTIPALATLHPAYLLRQPAQKRLAWRDLLLLKARLEARA